MTEIQAILEPHNAASLKVYTLKFCVAMGAQISFGPFFFWSPVGVLRTAKNGGKNRAFTLCRDCAEVLEGEKIFRILTLKIKFLRSSPQ
jgi:hypothetical protein